MWTTMRGMQDILYAVPEGTVTDFLFLRSREDWRVCRVLRHLAVQEIPSGVGNKPHFSREYYPGSPRKLGEIDRGIYVPGALGEWTVRTSLHLLTLYEQREVRDVLVLRRKALYPTKRVWWEHVEVPRGMAARVPQMVAFQGSQLTGEPLGGPYHLMLATLRAVEVADVFLGSICHHGHLWRLSLAIRSALAELTPERLRSADPSTLPLLEAEMKRLRLIKERAAPDWLQGLGGPRGLFRCAKALDDEGTSELSENLGDPRLPYGRDVRANLRVQPLHRYLADAGVAVGTVGWRNRLGGGVRGWRIGCDGGWTAFVGLTLASPRGQIGAVMSLSDWATCAWISWPLLVAVVGLEMSLLVFRIVWRDLIFALRVTCIGRLRLEAEPRAPAGRLLPHMSAGWDRIAAPREGASFAH